MKIRFEKDFRGDDMIESQELHFEIPTNIIKELGWEEGTLIEWLPKGNMETIDGVVQNKVVLKNIDDNILGEE